MGPARSRFLARLPAKTPVHPQKVPRNSFVKRNLPVSPTGSRFCAESVAQVLYNEEFANIWGEGGTPAALKRLLYPYRATVDFAEEFTAAGEVLAIFNGFRLVKSATLVLALTVLLQGGAFAQNVPHALDPAPLLPEETHTKYVPITGKERLTWFVNSTVGVESLAFAGPFSAGWGTAFKSPPEYPSNITGFAQRYGMRLTGVSTGNAMNATLGAIWGEDPRYFRAPDEPFKKRVVNVLDLTFRAYYRDGERHFAYARLAGNAGSSFLSNTWRVPSETTGRARCRASFTELVGMRPATRFPNSCRTCSN